MSRIFLKKEISVQDLEKGVEFEVDEIGNESDETFDDVVFDKNSELSAEYDDSVKPRFVTDVDIPFSRLKERMSPITDDGLVLKEVLKQGVGLPIPEKSIVHIHYDAFLEGQKETFDSTRLRSKPFKFLLGEGSLVPGLEIGIQSMKKGELSRIMVSPEYAFKEMGCPPRIPPNAEILYEVQVLKFMPGKDVVEFEEMSREDQKKAPFERIVGVYRCDNGLANDLFKRKLYKEAIARYRRLVTLLEEVSVANEEEDDQRKEYLLKLYLNLALCNLNIDSRRAIIYADLALKIDSKNTKGLYLMGRALCLDFSFERAEHYLCAAKKQKPLDKAINKALKDLEEKRKYHLKVEKLFCKRMFGSQDENQKPVVKLEEPPEFVELIDGEIKKFLESDEKELHFQPTYTESQLDVVKNLAREYNLAFVSKFMNDVKINKVAKKSI